MRHIRIIGIGIGDPAQITVQAITAMRQTDVFFFVDKGDEKGELREVRRELCRRHLDDGQYRIVEIADPARASTGAYDAAVHAWHQARLARWAGVLAEELADGQHGAFLVWGDPGLYDSTLRILEEVRAGAAHGLDLGLELDVIPGISAVQALAARHQIPLNRIGQSVLITTGRRLLAEWGNGGRDVVVMLDAHCSFLELDDPGTVIYWGAYLGTEDEILISGTIAECGQEIARARAASRAAKGWVFDTYLLRPGS